MKFLYFGDRHYSAAKLPPNRVDDFKETTKNKDLEIIDIAKRENVSAFLQPGDFFNEKDVNGENDFLAEIIDRWNMPSASSLLSKYFNSKNKDDIIDNVNKNIPMIGIAGNHDLIGNSLDTLSSTTLGLLSSLGLMRLVSKDNPVFFETEDGLKVAITGTSYHLHQDDKEYIDDYIVKEKLGDIHIHLVHGMLSEKDLGPLIKHTLIDNIVETKADITLCGHNHIGFGVLNIKDKYFVNIGSVTRFTGDLKEMTRTPSVALIDISKDRVLVKEIPLKTAPLGTDVIDRSAIEEDKKKKIAINKFRKEAESMKTKTKPDMSDFVESIADNESIPDEIKNDILDRLVIKEKEKAKVKAVKTNAYVKKIVLENFQSHKYNEFELDNGLNVFVGETRQGKSAILRAFYWVYENKPSGKRFIKRGEMYARVTLYLSDGTIISRFIEDKKSGKNGYEITYPDGSSEVGNTKLLEKVQKLLGFNHFYIDQKLSLPVNFYKQGESWYLIGDNQTSTDKARIIGALSGTNIADAIIRDLDTENTKSLVSYKVAKQKSEDISKEINSFNYLPDLKTKLDNMKILMNRYKSLELLKTTLESLSSKRISLRDNIKEKDSLLDTLKDLDYAKNSLQKLKNLENNLTLLELNHRNFLRAKKLLEEQLNILNNLVKISDAKNNLSKLKELKSSYEKLNELNQKIDFYTHSISEKIDIIRQTEQIDFISDACKMIRDAELELSELTNTLNTLNSIIFRKEDLKKKIVLVDNRINSFNKLLAFEKNLDKLKELNNGLDLLRNGKEQYVSFRDKLSRENIKLVNANNNLRKAKDNYAKVLEETHICPICKEILDEEKINEIVYDKKGN